MPHQVSPFFDAFKKNTSCSISRHTRKNKKTMKVIREKEFLMRSRFHEIKWSRCSFSLHQRHFERRKENHLALTLISFTKRRQEIFRTPLIFQSFWGPSSCAADFLFSLFCYLPNVRFDFHRLLLGARFPLPFDRQRTRERKRKRKADFLKVSIERSQNLLFLFLWLLE